MNKIRKAIKDAAEHVQVLQDSFIVVNLLLSRIRVAGDRALPSSPQPGLFFESLCKRADIDLNKVDETLKKVIAQSPSHGDGSDKNEIDVSWRKWFMNRGALADLTGKLADVRKALYEMLEFLQVYVLTEARLCDNIAHLIIMAYRNYLEHIAERVDNVELIVNTMSVVQSYHSYVA